MQLRILALAAVLIGAVSGPPASAQNQGKRDLKAQQKVEEEAEKRQELRKEVQPMADRFAEAMVTRKYSDSLVQGYVSSLGQSLVPPDSPASTTFSFRVVQDIYPNASALPDGRIYLTTGMLAHVENEAQLAMVLGHEIGHVIEELALARGFDPEEAVRFWERQHERFGKRSLRPKIGNSLFGSHPRDRVRAENLRALLAADLKSAIDDKRTGGGLVTGTPRFGNVISGLMRDTGTLMAERSDRHDLAIGLLEKARQHRPNDPRLLWALGRTYRMVARTDEKLTEGDSLLATASEQDKRGIYPAIHRDIAYAMASQSEDYAAATEHLRKYVDGHIAVHGRLPLDIDDVYDKMVLFGDNEWMPASAQKAGSAQTIQVSSEVGYHPTVWDSPADLAAYDAALQSSTQQIENSFGVVVADEQAEQK